MTEYIVRMPPDMPYEIRAELNAWYVESEPIVRCRDCRHYNEQEPGGEIGTCNLGLEDLDLLFIVEPDGFCAWGTRRDE